MAEALLEAEDLVVTYGRGRGLRGAPPRPVLDGVSLRIARGEMLGIVGESGSGKTTLGRALLGLVAPASGRVSFNGVEISGLGAAEMRPLRRRLQMIFQDPMSSLNPRRRIGRILAAPLLLHRLARSKADAREQAAAILGKVGLPSDAARRFPHELSGGQRQRLGIARAILLKPDFILADEIVSGLDVSTQAQVLDLIGSLQRELGLAMAFISHDLSVVRMICDRVMVLCAGAVVEEGTCEAVFTRPRSDYTRGLIDAIPRPVHDPRFFST